MSDDTNRIFLWGVPRTVSTAVVKCLSFVEGLRVVNQPYYSAFHFGPERKKPLRDLTNTMEKRLREIHDYSSIVEEVRGYDDSVCTYGYVRDELLQSSNEHVKILLCRENALYLDAKYHMLPKGFKYSFLIRHPAKVFLSWKKHIQDLFGESFSRQVGDLLKIPDTIFPAGCGFKELYELVEYVEKDLGQEPVILDTDDLLADPAGVLSAYCLKMGIPYTPELLSWEAGGAIQETWIVSKTTAVSIKTGFYDNALQSTGFGSLKPPPAVESLPADVQACVTASMGYYEKLREKRIRPLSDS